MGDADGRGVVLDFTDSSHPLNNPGGLPVAAPARQWTDNVAATRVRVEASPLCWMLTPVAPVSNPRCASMGAMCGSEGGSFAA